MWIFTWTSLKPLSLFSTAFSWASWQPRAWSSALFTRLKIVFFCPYFSTLDPPNPPPFYCLWSPKHLRSLVQFWNALPCTPQQNLYPWASLPAKLEPMGKSARQPSQPPLWLLVSAVPSGADPGASVLLHSCEVRLSQFDDSCTRHKGVK